MRYIYYIIGIIILATAGLSLLSLDRTAVEVSKPALVINDRVITEQELNDMMASKPHDMTEEQHIDSVVIKELLIQQALERKIHKEESFRKAVENYYEQSLVKILLDRKFKDFEAKATEAELERYQNLLGKKVTVTKKLYKTLQDAQKGKNARVESISGPFEYLSDSLRFTLLHLEPGETSNPRQTEKGFARYSLEKIQDRKKAPGKKDFNMDRAKTLITDQKKEMLYDQWVAELRQKANIWRRK